MARATDTGSAAPLPAPDDATLPSAQRLPVLLEHVKQGQKSLRTLEADFFQHRESTLLAAPEEAKGVFSYQAPDRVRWEYESPKAMTLVINDQVMTTWYRDLGRADRLKIGKYSNEALRFLGASGSLDTLQQYFKVNLGMPKDPQEPFRLELEPRYARIAKRLKAMTLWLDRKSYLPVRLRYVEADGDSTEYRFENVRTNADLPADRFVLNLPDSVKVRTLQTGQGQ
jgi:outer membrane lipoprotein carrier protein